MKYNHKTRRKCIDNEGKGIKTRLRYEKIGSTYAFWFDKEGDPLIVIGPHCNLTI